MKFKLSNISTYRNFLMGFAIIWIMFVHTTTWFNFGINILDFLKNIGYGGVDIFLLCSGMGCYFSFTKNYNIMEFIKRRLKKIMPTWVIFICIWIIFRSFTDPINMPAIIGNIFFIQDYTGLGNSFNWYMSGLILLYFLTPYFVYICNKFNIKHNFLFIVFLIILSVSFCGNKDLIIIFARIPIYYIGILIGKYQKTNSNYEFSLNEILILLCTSFIGFLLLYFFMANLEDYIWDYGLKWYPFILITPGLCLILCCFSKLLAQIKLSFINITISYLGQISFNIFVIHIFIFNITKNLMRAHIIQSSNIRWLIIMIISIIISILFKYFVDFIVKVITYILSIQPNTSKYKA